MVKSKSYNDNWIVYFWLEIAIKSLLAFTGCFMILLFVFLRGTKADSGLLEYFLERPVLYMSICLIPVFITVLFIVSKSSRWKIVGFDFKEENIELLVRKNQLKTLKLVVLSLSELKVYTKSENSFGMNGKRFFVLVNQHNLENYWFSYDLYIWEKQGRDKVLFKKKISSVAGVNLPAKPKELKPNDVLPRY